MSSKFHKIKNYEVREDALKYIYDLSDCFLVLWSNQHGFLEAVDDIFEHLREYCPLVKIFFGKSKNRNVYPSFSLQQKYLDKESEGYILNSNEYKVPKGMLQTIPSHVYEKDKFKEVQEK